MFVNTILKLFVLQFTNTDINRSKQHKIHLYLIYKSKL